MARPNPSITNGKERDMLIVCDPPELGWVDVRDDEHATADAEMLAAPPRAPHCDCEQACDECVYEAVRNG
jgi:hypothetical protein